MFFSYLTKKKTQICLLMFLYCSYLIILYNYFLITKMNSFIGKERYSNIAHDEVEAIHKNLPAITQLKLTLTSKIIN